MRHRFLLKIGCSAALLVAVLLAMRQVDGSRQVATVIDDGVSGCLVFDDCSSRDKNGRHFVCTSNQVFYTKEGVEHTKRVGACEWINQNGSSCDSDFGCKDGNPCTSDRCEDGRCVMEDTDICDDGNPDTQDVCHWISENEELQGYGALPSGTVDQCTHTLACGEGEIAYDGKCIPDRCADVTCESAPDGCHDNPVCDPLTGECGEAAALCEEEYCVNNQCVECVTDEDCDDGVDCTDDTCTGNACTHAASEKDECKDHCEGQESPANGCQMGTCDPKTGKWDLENLCPGRCVDDACVDCVTDEDCDDHDACTLEVCFQNICLAAEQTDADGDGTCDEEDPCPKDAYVLPDGPNGCVPKDCQGFGGDTDGDAICNDLDPCPEEYGIYCNENPEPMPTHESAQEPQREVPTPRTKIPLPDIQPPVIPPRPTMLPGPGTSPATEFPPDAPVQPGDRVRSWLEDDVVTNEEPTGGIPRVMQGNAPMPVPGVPMLMPLLPRQSAVPTTQAVVACGDGLCDVPAESQESCPMDCVTVADRTMPTVPTAPAPIAQAPTDPGAVPAPDTLHGAMPTSPQDVVFDVQALQTDEGMPTARPLPVSTDQLRKRGEETADMPPVTPAKAPLVKIDTRPPAIAAPTMPVGEVQEETSVVRNDDEVTEPTVAAASASSTADAPAPQTDVAPAEDPQYRLLVTDPVFQNRDVSARQLGLCGADHPVTTKIFPFVRCVGSEQSRADSVLAASLLTPGASAMALPVAVVCALSIGGALLLRKKYL